MQRLQSRLFIAQDVASVVSYKKGEGLLDSLVHKTDAKVTFGPAKSQAAAAFRHTRYKASPGCLSSVPLPLLTHAKKSELGRSNFTAGWNAEREPDKERTAHIASTRHVSHDMCRGAYHSSRKQVLCKYTYGKLGRVNITYYCLQGASQPGPNYTLFVGLASIVIPVCMVLFPWLYESKGKFRHFGKFFLKPRTSLIFTGFYTGFWCTAGIAMTVHANNPDHCNLDSDLQKSYGDDYTSSWSSQVRKKEGIQVKNGYTYLTLVSSVHAPRQVQVYHGQRASCGSYPCYARSSFSSARSK